MRLSNWHIIPCNDGITHYFYGDLEYYIENDDLTAEEIEREIPFENAKTSNFIELINNYYEDINRHSMPNTINMIQNLLQKCELPEEKLDAFWKNYCEKLYNDEI